MRADDIVKLKIAYLESVCYQLEKMNSELIARAETPDETTKLIRFLKPIYEHIEEYKDEIDYLKTNFQTKVN